MAITYRGLLNFVAKGEAPKRIKYGTFIYHWNGCEYEDDTGSRLSEVLQYWTTQAQVTADFLEVITDVLTDEEKEYLGAVIKPYKKHNRINFIQKSKYTNSDFESIHINLDSDFIDLPYFPAGEMYKWMELDRKYTLEELDL